MSNIKDFIPSGDEQTGGGGTSLVGSISTSSIKKDTLNNGKLVRMADVVLDRGMYPELSAIWGDSNVAFSQVFDAGVVVGYYNDIDYANGKWIAVGGPNSNSASFSLDGLNWDNLNSALNQHSDSVTAIKYANGIWMAGSGSGSAGGNFIATSTTGNQGSWTYQTIGLGLVNDLSFSPNHNRWVAVGNQGNIETSDDNGVTWVRRATNIAGTSAIQKVHYANNLFIAVGSNTRIVASSDGGLSWSQTNQGTNILSLRAVTYGNGLWAVVGNNTSGNVVILTTSDGINWSENILPEDTIVPLCITYSDVFNMFVIGFTTGLVGFSSDLTNWQYEQISGFFGNVNCIKMVGDRIVIGTNDSTIFRTYYLEDMYLPEITINSDGNQTQYHYIRVEN